MRIAITNPTNWPLARRGVERVINELARYLSARGHEVELVSTHPELTVVSHREGYITRMYRSLWHPFMLRFGLLEFHLFFLTTAFHLVPRRYDVAFCCTFMDAFAA